MYTLHQFVPNPKVPDPSAFVSKVQLFMKINDIEFKGTEGDPRKAPKGKLPVLGDSDGNRLIADSESIIRYLSDKLHIDTEAGLTTEQKALSFMIRRTMEEHLYFIVLHARWVNEAGWAVAKPLFFGKLPKPLQFIVPGIVRKQVEKSLHSQGIARHEQEEIDRRAHEVLDHLKVFMGKSDFIFGDKPTLVDCTVFPYLWGAIHWPSDNELKRVVQNHPPFVAYVERIMQRYYS